MNTTTFRLRYGIAILVSVLAAKDYGPGGFIGAFIGFNGIWTLAEEALITRHNFKQTARWRRDQEK